MDKRNRFPIVIESESFFDALFSPMRLMMELNRPRSFIVEEDYEDEDEDMVSEKDIEVFNEERRILESKLDSFKRTLVIPGCRVEMHISELEDMELNIDVYVVNKNKRFTEFDLNGEIYNIEFSLEARDGYANGCITIPFKDKNTIDNYYNGDPEKYIDYLLPIIYLLLRFFRNVLTTSLEGFTR